VVIRFWIVAFVLALAGLATLKLRWSRAPPFLLSVTPAKAGVQWRRAVSYVIQTPASGVPAK